jgi:2-polyprenyl-3-methyl-5-hydroxy-6-metoxy-1,4-benzoquinol methylase
MDGGEKSLGLISLSRDEIYDKIIGMLLEQERGRLLDVPTGTGVLADRLQKMGFNVSCCDINPSFFAAKDLTVQFGDMNTHLPYEAECFDYIICLDGLEHAENPLNAIREFSRIIKKGGRLFISIPNYLNIERRMRFLITGVFSKLAPRLKYREALKGDVSMLHINQMGYPVLKFFLQWNQFRVIKLDIDRPKPKLKYFLPLVWLIRFYCFFWPEETRKAYLLDETLSDQILMGGNTLIVVAEKGDSGSS